MTKQIIINAFDMACSGHQSPGLWAHPSDKSSTFDTIEYWINLAKLLERGGFNAIGGYDVYGGPRNIGPAAQAGAQWPVLEPGALVPLMASVTKNLSFGVTFSTISEHPYHFARRLATLDHLTKGRVGWNIVTSFSDSTARNLLNKEKLSSHENRYETADEYLRVVEELLLSSWRDDAVVKDPETRIYTKPEAVREIEFHGKHYHVPGPSITHPSPQRLPLLLQAGTSPQGKEFAAKNAELVFIANWEPETLAENIKDIKKLSVEKYGREPDAIKFLQLIATIIGVTHEEAEAKYKEYKSYGDKEGAQALFSGWTGIDLSQFGEDEELRDVDSNAIRGLVANWTKISPGDDPNLRKTRSYVAEQIVVGGLGPVFYGTADEVADTIEHWVNITGVDGFNFAYITTPGTFEEIVDYLIPVLRKRGLVPDGYPTKDNNETLTFRENVFGINDIHNPEDPTFVRPSHPAYNLRWRDGSREEFEANLGDKTKKQKVK